MHRSGEGANLNIFRGFAACQVESQTKFLKDDGDEVLNSCTTLLSLDGFNYLPRMSAVIIGIIFNKKLKQETCPEYFNVIEIEFSTRLIIRGVWD